MAKSSEVTVEQCLELLEKMVELIKSEDDRLFARVKRKNGNPVLVPIESVNFMDCLRIIMNDGFKKLLNKSQIKELQEHAAALARSKSIKEKIFIRYRRGKTKTVIDLADELGRAVLIAADGVKILEAPKTYFYQPKGQLPLEEFKRCKIIDGFKKLRKYIKNVSFNDFRLIISWMVDVIYSNGPYPILILQGEQGSAKTFIMKALRSIFDPVKSPVRSLPQGERDFIIMANNSVVLPFDNVSYLKPWMPDAFCRIASGGGYSSRKLYTDDDEMYFNLCRPFIMNGIPDFVTKNDMADRVIMIMMESISDAERKTEEELWNEFQIDKPYILGALYEAVRMVITNIDNVKIEKLPRMADFAKIACAVAPGLKWTEQEFLEAYNENRRITSTACLDADEVALAVLDYVKDENEWVGPALMLLQELTAKNPESAKKRYWPTTPSKLSNRLRTAAPGLRKNGVEVVFSRSGKNRKIKLKYTGS